MNSFLEKIKQEKEYLSHQFLSQSPKLDFIQEFISTNKLNSINGIINVDFCDLVIAFLCSNNLEFEKVKRIITACKSLFDLETEKYKLAIYTINYFLDFDKKSPVSLKNKKYEKDISKLYKKLCKENDIAGLNELLVEDYENVLKILFLVETIKSMQDTKEIIEEHFSEFEEKYGEKSIKKSKNRIYTNSMKDMFYINNIKKVTLSIEAYYLDETKKIKSHNSKIKKEIKKYEEFEQKFLPLLAKKEISDVSSLIKLISNPTLKKELLINIYNHNLPYWLAISDEYNHLSEDYNNQIKILFNKYKLNYDELDIKCPTIELSELEYFLQIITEYNITDKQIIKYIIMNSSKEILETISLLIKNNIITVEFLLHNISILNKNYNESMYPVLIKNIKALKDNQLNTRLLTKNPQILLTPTDLFTSNLAILNSYNLIDSLKNTSEYEFLASANLTKKIDRILELGYEKNLLENLALLNFDLTSWNNIVVYKLIGEEFSTTAKLIKALEEPISSEYIFNYVNYLAADINNKEITLDNLAPFENKTLTYNINGILISKNKVKRAYSNNNIIRIKDVVENSILTEDEFNALIEGLNSNYKI